MWFASKRHVRPTRHPEPELERIEWNAIRYRGRFVSVRKSPRFGLARSKTILSRCFTIHAPSSSRENDRRTDGTDGTDVLATRRFAAEAWLTFPLGKRRSRRKMESLRKKKDRRCFDRSEKVASFETSGELATRKRRARPTFVGR